MYKIYQEKQRTERTDWKYKECAEAMIKILTQLFPNEEFRIITPQPDASHK